MTVRFWDLEAATTGKHGLSKLRHKTRRNIFSRELLRVLALDNINEKSIMYNKPRTLALRSGGLEVAVGVESGKIAKNIRVHVYSCILTWNSASFRVVTSP